MEKKLTIPEDIENRIGLYVNGQLEGNEIDELWTDLIQNGDYLNYLKTVVAIKFLRSPSATTGTYLTANLSDHKLTPKKIVRG